LNMGLTSAKMKARTEQADRFVTEVWEESVAPGQRSKSCVMAVGGYGREELFPHSDIDLLILEEPNTFSPGELSEFLRKLWDAGYRASHSVHSVADCKRISPGNVEFSISLLDRRMLVGNAAIAKSCDDVCRKPPPDLAAELARMTERRHERFQHTIQHLEPDIKETCGGLRDLNAVRWFAKLGVEQAPDLAAESEVLFAIRWALHEHAGRDQNLLRFAEQDALSDAPEVWMRDYFRQARRIYAACRELKERVLDRRPGLMGSFFESRSKLSNEEFTVSREQILLRHPAAFQTDPSAPFRLFSFQARHGLKLARDTQKRIRSAPQWTWKEWKALLDLPHAAMALRAMAETGFLGEQLPEWEHVDCLVVRDFYHRYTVDEHTIIALENLEALGFEQQQFGALWLNCDTKAVLRFALLLHDVGKGMGGDHDARAVELAASIGARIGIPATDLSLIQRLIGEHLYLGTLITTRDLDDPDVARQAAHRMETKEYLAMLALLTIADSSAVFPGAMTTWRRSQLWHAHTAIERELTKELEDERIVQPAELSPELSEFVKGFPTRYWFRTIDPERQQHLALSTAAMHIGVASDLRKRQDDWQLTVVTKDRPRLLADLSGTLASYGMNILKAEAFGNSRGEVLDIFVFADPLRSLELNPTIVDELKEAIRRVVLGKETAERLLKRRPKTTIRYRMQIDTILRFDNQTSQFATLLELQAQDRPGLLYDLARTISQNECEIETVLLHTEGQRAVDVFYLRKQGEKLTESQVETLGASLRQVMAN
jgi:[protein-PII] uridylyltransferase